MSIVMMTMWLMLLLIVKAPTVRTYVAKFDGLMLMMDADDDNADDEHRDNGNDE